MKIIILVESDWKQFEDMLSKLDKPSVLLNTGNCKECEEYDMISNTIDLFALSEVEVMVVKYSGREDVARSLGDNCPQMIIPVSYNETSLNYMEHPVETFLELVDILEKETVIKW